MWNLATSAASSTGVDRPIHGTRLIRFPTAIDPAGPLKNTPAYLPLANIAKTGFEFRFADLLHAIGCKTANLSSSDSKKARNAAQLYAHILRMNPAGHLVTKGGVDPDLRTPRSQEIGIGLTCLVARHYWRFTLDSLEPIRGRGKRFDYRAKKRGLTGIFEAKGSSSTTTQTKQVTNGLVKKRAHHARGETHDIELIVASLVGSGAAARNRLVLADPFFDEPEWHYSDEGDRFYRIRHYSRVLRYAGLGAASGSAYLTSLAMIHDLGYRAQRSLARLRRDVDDEPPQSVQEVGGGKYLGRWVESADLDDSQRDFEPRSEPGRRVFQGIRAEVYEAVVAGSVEVPQFQDGLLREGKLTWSVFEDGSIFGLVEEPE